MRTITNFILLITLMVFHLSVYAQVQVLDPPISLEDPFLIHNETDGTQIEPVTKVLNNGNYILAWIDRQDIDNQVKFKIYDIDSQQFGDEIIVYSVQNNIVSLTMAIDGDGNFTFIWNSGQAFARQFFANGQAKGDVFRVSNGFVNSPYIAMNSSGRFVTTWSWGEDIFSRIYNADGSPATEPFLVNQAHIEELVPRVGIQENGNFVIGWRRRDPVNNYDIIIRAFEANGNPLIDEYTINQTLAGIQYGVNFIAKEDGFLITWIDGSNFASRECDVNGNPIGNEKHYNSNNGTPAHSFPTLRAGILSFIWKERINNRIYLRQYNEDANPLTNRFELVDTQTPGDLGFDMANNNVGGLVITWTQNDGNPNYNCYAQVYQYEYLQIVDQAIAENEPQGSIVGEIFDNPNFISHEIIPQDGNNDHDSFELNNKILIATESFNYEEKNNYNITIRSTLSNNESITKTFLIEVNNVNEVPLVVSLNNQEDIPENDADFLNRNLGQFSSTDTDLNDTHSFAFFDDGNPQYNNLFEIREENGVYQLFARQQFDFEDAAAPANNLYRIVVRSTDAGALNSEPHEFFIQVVNVFEDGEPVPYQILIDNDTIEENNPEDVIIALLSIDPNDANVTYTFEDNAQGIDNQFFEIINNELHASERFNFERPVSSNGDNNYHIFVSATENNTGNVLSRNAFILRVTDVNDVPFQVNLNGNTILENDDNFNLNVIGVFNTIDEDAGDVHTYEMAENNILFRIQNNQLLATRAFDFEEEDRYVIKIQSRDQGGLLSQVFNFTISIIDVNENPTAITLSNNTINENNAANELVGSFSTTDPDNNEVHAYELVNGEGSEDNAAFRIENNRLFANESFDFETQASYSIRVRSTDSGLLFTEEIFLISINDLPELSPIAAAPKVSRIFPNPNLGSFNVNMLGLNFEEIRVLIYDQHGKLRWANRLDNNADQIISIHPPQLARGVYFVEVIMAKGRYLEQIIIL